MLRRLWSIFRPVETRSLPLEFQMDMDETGRHVVQVFIRGKNEKRQPIRNIQRFWGYGFKLTAKSPNGQIFYTLNEEDRQTLLSLKSMNPEIREDGALVFEIEPGVLRYLRKKKNTAESEASRQLHISEKPLRPSARLNFDPQNGLEVETGYAIDESNSLVPPEELHKSKDQRYVRISNTFMPLDEISLQGKKYLDEQRTNVPVPDVVKYLDKVLPTIEKDFDVLQDPKNPVEVSQQPLQPVARISFQPKTGLQIETGFELKDKNHLVPLQDLQTSRDEKYILVGRTFHPLSRLSQPAKKFLENPRQTIHTGNVPEFFQRDLVLIKKEFNAVLTDLAQQIQVVTDPLVPVVKVDKDQRGWLDFKVAYQAAGIDLPYGLLAKRKNQDYIQVDDHTWVKVDRAQLEKAKKGLEELEAVAEDDKFRLPASEFVSLEEFIRDIGGRAELSKAYRAFLDQLTGFIPNEHFTFSEKFEEQLRQQERPPYPYQRAGVHWLDWLRSNHLHGILADDMGLGKTLQSLCALRLGYEQTKSQAHSLIVAPKSVLHHWEREIHRCYPYMRVHVYHGPKRKSTVFQTGLPHVFITTYDTVNRDIDELAKVPLFYLVLDEATRIKNPDAQRTQAIKALNAAHRLALSGTPVENRPAELWSMFDFLMRGHLGRYGTFVRVYEDKIMAGNQQAAQQLGRRISPFILRRKKEDVAKDLPEKIVLQEWCDLTQEQRQLYGGLQDEVKKIRAALRRGENVSYTSSILPVLTKLKQICDHPALVTHQPEPLYGRSEKFDWIVSRIDEIVHSGEQVVVFSHFLNMLGLFEAVVREKKISYIRIDGSSDNRQQLIDVFNSGKAKVALLSLMAAGYGINLTAANHVIHADRWWNPAVEDQATDRVHRIGQNRTVYVYHILVEGTLEERIESLLEKKRGMADRIVGAAVDGPRQWSREELIELLKPLE
jgi:hypothetical protein